MSLKPPLKINWPALAAAVILLVFVGVVALIRRFAESL